MTAPEPATEGLIERVVRGDGGTRQQLLARNRTRLRRMIALRLDRRLAVRVDPSDVVQEALADADRKLTAYVRERPLPFYPWLRRLAWERLIKVHRRRLRTHRRPRGAGRAEPARRVGRGAGAAAGVVRVEPVPPATAGGDAPARDALAAPGERDREVLVLRYLEQLSTRDVAAVLGISEAAVKVRRRVSSGRGRALEQRKGLALRGRAGRGASFRSMSHGTPRGTKWNEMRCRWNEMERNGAPAAPAGGGPLSPRVPWR